MDDYPQVIYIDGPSERVYGVISDAAFVHREVPPVPSQPDHFWDNVVFQVENAFFKVPTHHFVTHSEVFADMLSLPQGQAAAAEGQSKENPIVLPVTEQDFRRLLRALYPLEAPRYPSFNKDELISLLKLSKLWAMKRVREYAVEKITEILNSIDAIERVTLAREYSVEKWLRSGYMALATRYPVVSTEDAQLIGWKPALLLEHVREEAYASMGGGRMGRASLSEYQVQYILAFLPVVPKITNPVQSSQKEQLAADTSSKKRAIEREVVTPKDKAWGLFGHITTAYFSGSASPGCGFVTPGQRTKVHLFQLR